MYETYGAMPMGTENSYGPEEQELIKKRKRGTIIKLIALIPLAAFFIFMFIGGITMFSDIRTFDAKDTSYTEFMNNEVYYFSEMTLIDLVDSGYEYTSDIATPDTYLVSFKDKNGELCFAYLSVSYDDAIEETCYEYIMDDTKIPGDVVLSGCFKGYDDEISDYRVQEYISEMSGKTVNIRFYYEGHSVEAYMDAERRQPLMTMIIGLMALVPLIICVIRIFKKSKNVKNNPAAAAAPEEILKKYAKGKNKKKICLIALCVSAVFVVIGYAGFFFTEKLMIFAAFGMIGAVTGGVLYSVAVREATVRVKIDELFPTEEALLAELHRAYYADGEFLYTPQLLVLPGGRIIPKNMILWLYIRKQKTYGITVSRSVMVTTVECKQFEVPLGGMMDEEKFTRMLNTVINTLPPNIILGYSQESINRYREYKKQYKANKK